MDHINLNKHIGSDTDGRMRVQVFNMNAESDVDLYEAIINNPDITVLSESNPQMDRAGRLMVLLK